MFPCEDRWEIFRAQHARGEATGTRPVHEITRIAVETTTP